MQFAVFDSLKTTYIGYIVHTLHTLDNVGLEGEESFLNMSAFSAYLKVNRAMNF